MFARKLHRVACAVLTASLVSVSGFLAYAQSSTARIARELAAIKAVSVQTGIVVDGRQDFTANILKYDFITLQPGAEIRFTDHNAPFVAVVTPRLQIRDLGATYAIGYAGSNLDLSGSVGTEGRAGSPAYDPWRAANGEAGGHAGDAGSGGPGKTKDRGPILILVQEIVGPSGPLTPDQIRNLRLRIVGGGIPGGDGGAGGRGGNGGFGAGGRGPQFGEREQCRGRGDMDSCRMVRYCADNPTPGGPGGNAGRGGSGGTGGDGGDGATVWLLSSEMIARGMSFWPIDTVGGPGGAGGAPGSPGVVGGGGAPVYHTQPCPQAGFGPGGSMPSPTSGTPGGAGAAGERGAIVVIGFDVSSVIR